MSKVSRIFLFHVRVSFEFMYENLTPKNDEFELRHTSPFYYRTIKNVNQYEHLQT